MANIFTTHKLSRLIGSTLMENAPQETSKLGDDKQTDIMMKLEVNKNAAAKVQT